MNYKNITKLSILALTAGCMTFSSCTKEDETTFINNPIVDSVKAAQSAIKYKDVTNLVQVDAEGVDYGMGMPIVVLLPGQTKQIFSSEFKKVYSDAPEAVKVDNNGVITAVAPTIDDGPVPVYYFIGNETKVVLVSVIDPNSDYAEFGGLYEPISLSRVVNEKVSSPLLGTGTRYAFYFGDDDYNDRPSFSLFVPEGKFFQDAEVIQNNEFPDGGESNLTITPKSEGVYRIDLEMSFKGFTEVVHFTYDMNEN